MKSSLFAITFFALLFLIMGCSTLQELAKMQSPSVSFSEYKITGLSLETADLLFDFKVENPNPVAIDIKNYTYDFQIDEQSFLQGSQVANTTIDASGESTVQVPVTLRYDDLVQSFRSVLSQDEINYSIDAVIGTDVPILGLVELPITHEGTVPVVKLPKLKIASFRVDDLSISKASLMLGIEIANNNIFGVDLNNMNYSIDLNGLSVVEGQFTEAIQIEEKSTSTVEVPVEFNLLQLGMSAYRMLSSNNPIEYSIIGNSNIGVDLPYFKSSSFDFSQTGTVNLTN